MDIFQIIGVLITGGALTLVGSIASTVMTNRAEDKRAARRRQEELADRNFATRKEVYAAVLNEFMQASLIRHSGQFGKQVSEEQALRMNQALSHFELFASNDVHLKITPVIKLLAQSFPEDKNERGVFLKELGNEIQNLVQAIKADLNGYAL